MSKRYNSRKLRLNKTNVEDLEPPAEGVLVVWDDLPSRFHLKLRNTGSRTYYVRVRAPGERTEGDIKLGRHGELTAEQARRRAKHILGLVAGGQDPRPARRARAAQLAAQKKRDITLGALCESWLTEHQKRDARGAYGAWLRQAYGAYIKPEFGQILVREFGPEHIRRLHGDHKERPAVANVMVRFLSSVFDFAEPHYMPAGSNPCWKLVGGKKKWCVEFYPDIKRTRTLSNEELERVAVAIAEFIDEERITAAEADLIRVKLLTGCRSSELYRLEWKAVHLEERYFDLPAHKTRYKTGSPRIVVLSEMAAALIDRQPRVADHVFYNHPDVVRRMKRGGVRKPGPIGILRLEDIWSGRPEGKAEGLRKRAGLPDVRLHDLRRTAATVAGGQANLNAHLVCALFGWTNLQQAKTYVRPQLEPLIAGANAVAAGLMPALNGIDLPSLTSVASPNQDANIAELRRQLAVAQSELAELRAKSGVE
jgi:integrase